jgi:hypothetical protein
MAARRTPLWLERARARVWRDARGGDMWPDPGGLIDLPRSKPEFAAFRRRLSALRTGRARAATPFLVPKRDGLTRPGHLIAPMERVFFQALVDTFMHDADRQMVSQKIVFGYRTIERRSSPIPYGKQPTKQWLNWRRTYKDALRTGKYQAAINTDVASFFEQIDHGKLRTRLGDFGVASATIDELMNLLADFGRGWGATKRGLPQGTSPARILSSLFLDPVDKEMTRAPDDALYFRFIDDIWLCAPTEAEARRALRRLEKAMRSQGLNLQPGKTKIFLGATQIKAEVIDADDEADAVDYAMKRNPKRGLVMVKRKWRSASRRKPMPQRLIKMLMNRLRWNDDGYAIGWCLARLGVLDWLSDVVGPYLALFIDRKAVQVAIATHLSSPMNLSSWQEVHLFRACLSAKSIGRPILDHARTVLENKNADTPARQWAAVVLGHHGDAADHVLLVRHHLDNTDLARATAVAVQTVDPTTRRDVWADVANRYPEQKDLIGRLKGRKRPFWPVYE